MRHKAAGAVLNAALRQTAVPAAVRSHRIERTVAEQAVEILRISALVARKILAAAISEEAVVPRRIRAADSALCLPEEFFIHLFRHSEQVPDPVLAKNFPRASAPDALPLLHTQDPVAYFQSQIDLVQGHHNSAPLLREFLQCLHQFRPVAQVQIRGGLVEQKDRRILGDGSGHEDALLLSVADRVKIAF